MHAVLLALKARKMFGEPVDESDLIQQRSMGLDDAETMRALRARERELENLLRDEDQTDPVREEALRELKEIADFQRKSPWRTRDNAQKCVRAVSMAITRLHKHLAEARDIHGRPDLVSRAFANHINRRILIPSGRGGNHGGARFITSDAGCFTYKPPVTWTGLSSQAPHESEEPEQLWY
jgi:hypothetical protein